MDSLISPDELALHLAVPATTLAQWRYLGRGPAYLKVGRHVRYRVADVERWLAQQTVSPRWL
ncbi:MAG: helix-turn-helix transcriptional regulator [Acidimicrobiia bacterium]